MRLFEAGTLSRIDLEAAQYSHRLAALEREALRAQFTQREAAVRAAKIDLAHCRITAPLDGIVLSREVEPGGFVDVAARYSSAPFVIATDPTQVQLELDVAEADIGSVSVGQKVVFTVDAHPGTAFDGTITQVRIGSTLKQQAVYYKIEAEVANSELLLRPGMTVDAKITTGDRRSVIVVPAAALRRVGDERYVDLLAGGNLRRHPVQTGLKDGAGLVEVVSGLTEGDRIVVSSGPE